jgi:hypothetical protein
MRGRHDQEMGGVLRVHLLVSEVRFCLSSPRYQGSGHQELEGYGGAGTIKRWEAFFVFIFW